MGGLWHCFSHTTFQWWLAKIAIYSWFTCKKWWFFIVMSVFPEGKKYIHYNEIMIIDNFYFYFGFYFYFYISTLHKWLSCAATRRRRAANAPPMRRQRRLASSTWPQSWKRPNKSAWRRSTVCVCVCIITYIIWLYNYINISYYCTIIYIYIYIYYIVT